MASKKRAKKDSGFTEEFNLHEIQQTHPKIELHIEEFKWTEKQKRFINLALNEKNSYLLCAAPPGVGKTLLATFVGLKLLNLGKINKIYFCRQPVESSSYGVGFLSGDLNSKMEPYAMPMLDHLYELISPEKIKYLIDSGIIEFIPVGMIKGRTFTKSLIIADESEDFDMKCITLLMSRLGKDSKMILIGDPNQVNIKNSGFDKVFGIFQDDESRENGVVTMTFGMEDIMRNKTIGFVLNKIKKAQELNDWSPGKS